MGIALSVESENKSRRIGRTRPSPVRVARKVSPKRSPKRKSPRKVSPKKSPRKSPRKVSPKKSPRKSPKRVSKRMSNSTRMYAGGKSAHESGGDAPSHVMSDDQYGDWPDYPGNDPPDPDGTLGSYDSNDK